MFLALGAWRACVPYTPAFQGIDLRVVRLLSAREKLAICNAVSRLVRLGARVVADEADGLGVRVELELRWVLKVSLCVYPEGG